MNPSSVFFFYVHYFGQLCLRSVHVRQNIVEKIGSIGKTATISVFFIPTNNNLIKTVGICGTTVYALPVLELFDLHTCIAVSLLFQFVNASFPFVWWGHETKSGQDARPGVPQCPKNIVDVSACPGTNKQFVFWFWKHKCGIIR